METIKQTIDALNKKGYIVNRERVGNITFYKVWFTDINGLLYMAKDLKQLNKGVNTL